MKLKLLSCRKTHIVRVFLILIVMVYLWQKQNFIFQKIRVLLMTNSSIFAKRLLEGRILVEKINLLRRREETSDVGIHYTNIRCYIYKNGLYFTAFQGCWSHFSMTVFSFHSTFCASWIPHQQPASLVEKCCSLFAKGHSRPSLTSCGRWLLKKMVVRSLSYGGCITSKT